MKIINMFITITAIYLMIVGLSGLLDVRILPENSSVSLILMSLVIVYIGMNMKKQDSKIYGVFTIVMGAVLLVISSMGIFI
ncbi:hypothetical protein SAMN05421687_10423 [Salimicrobium flavidum]|uniref:DUF3953 domain-containing protein n=1 Tax=Salimicrobium flavidum TaxID=570947 RepID=A0A1N7J6K2_9BACI|nr:hypothetical protein SAMN05421687_10423 [Salimicrobium flavidum]